MEQLRLKEGAKPEPFECFRPNEALQYIAGLHLVLYNERAISPKEARVQILARRPLK
jgi:hypothetical protein